MSWIVNELIRNRYFIKDSKDFDPNTREDLLSVERAIETLKKAGEWTDRETDIVDLISLGYSFMETGKRLGLHRNRVSIIFEQTCEKIANILGDYFTDEGFIKYMVEAHHLKEDQISTMKSYIRSIYKHRLLEEKYE